MERKFVNAPPLLLFVVLFLFVLPILLLLLPLTLLLVVVFDVREDEGFVFGTGVVDREVVRAAPKEDKDEVVATGGGR